MYKTQSKTDDVPIDMTMQTNLIFNEMAIQSAMKGEFNKALLLYNKIISSELKMNRGFKDVDFHYFINRGDCYRYFIYDQLYC